MPGESMRSIQRINSWIWFPRGVTKVRTIHRIGYVITIDTRTDRRSGMFDSSRHTTVFRRCRICYTFVIMRRQWALHKNRSRALIERPYSCGPQAVGAVYDRPGFFVQSPLTPHTSHLTPEWIPEDTR